MSKWVVRRGFFEPQRFLPFLIVVAFSITAIINAIVNDGMALLPESCFYGKAISYTYIFYSIVFFLFFFSLYYFAPYPKILVKKLFISKGIMRIIILFYAIISIFSLITIVNRSNLFSLIMNDGIAFTMLSLGAKVSDEHLMLYVFLLFTILISYALIENLGKSKIDLLVKSFISFILFLIIILFFIMGRRGFFLFFVSSIILMTPTFRRWSKSYFFISTVIILIIIYSIFILSVRSVSVGGSFITSEELSPVTISSYILSGHTSIENSFLYITPLRMFITNYASISSEYFSTISQSMKVTPVIGLVGVAHYFFIPVVVYLLFLGGVVNYIYFWFKREKTNIIRLLLVFFIYKSMIIFRDGEIPIMSLDLLMFIFIIFPVLFLGVKDNKVSHLMVLKE